MVASLALEVLEIRMRHIKFIRNPFPIQKIVVQFISTSEYCTDQFDSCQAFCPSLIEPLYSPSTSKEGKHNGRELTDVKNFEEILQNLSAFTFPSLILSFIFILLLLAESLPTRSGVLCRVFQSTQLLN